jgi:hypothetical protein
LDQENPTAGNGGASIEERLERFLSAEEPPAQQPQPEAKAADATQAEPEKTEPETGAPEDAAQPQLSTTELADILGIDESALEVGEDGKVQLKTKIDGKEGAAKLADVLKTHQLQGHVDNRSRAVAEQEKALQTRMQEAEQAVKARVDHLEQMANLAGSELMREYQSINWASLRQADPGQYAALQTDFQARRNQIQGVFQAVQTQRAQDTSKAEGQKAQYLALEAEKLPEVIPQWKDPAVRQKESQELVEWALKKGFSQQQVKELNESSALHVAAIRQAMLFDRLQTSKVEVENKVRLAPKIVKPGTPATNSKEAGLSDLKQQVRKSGGKGGSIEALLIARGIV